MAHTKASSLFLKSLGAEVYETKAAQVFDEVLAKSTDGNKMGLPAGASAGIARCADCGSVVHSKQAMASLTCGKCGGVLTMPGESAEDASAVREHAQEEDGRHTLPGGQLLKSVKFVQSQEVDHLGSVKFATPAHRLDYSVALPKGGREKISVHVHPDSDTGGASTWLRTPGQIPLAEKTSIARDAGSKFPHLKKLAWGTTSTGAVGEAGIFSEDSKGPYAKTSSDKTPYNKKASQRYDEALKNNPAWPDIYAKGLSSEQIEILEKAHKAKLGSGKRFEAIKEKAEEEGADDPGAVAAAAGRKKYGAKKMALMAARGRGHSTSKAINFYLEKLEKGDADKKVTTQDLQNIVDKSGVHQLLTKYKHLLPEHLRPDEDAEPTHYENNAGKPVCSKCASRDDIADRPAIATSRVTCSTCGKTISAVGQPEVKKSLGARKYEDLLFKSPRRKYSHPWEKYPGMPPEIVAGWKLLTGKKATGPDPKEYKSGITSEGKYHTWTNPSHPLHAAKIAFDWQQAFTKTARFGDSKVNQHAEGYKKRLDLLNSPHEGERRKAELREQALTDTHKHMERLGQHGAFHTPKAAIGAARADHMVNSVGRSHFTHEELGHVSEALHEHPMFAHMGDEVHHRLENFENFHDDAADAHHAQTGSYKDYRADATNIHPVLMSHIHSALGESKNKEHAGTFKIAEAAHEAMRAHPDVGAINTDNRKKEQ